MGVLLLVQEDVLQHVASASIAQALGQLDVLLVPGDGVVLAASSYDRSSLRASPSA
jgi:hypothetical protein